MKGLQAAYTLGNVISPNPSRNQGISHKDLVVSLATLRPTDALKARGLEAQVSIGVQTQTQTVHQKICQAQTNHLQASQVQIQAREEGLILSEGDRSRSHRGY